MRSLLARFASFVAPLVVCGGVHAAEPGPLPPELVESFTKSIQPLLLNRCATGGCGRPSKPSSFAPGWQKH